MRQEFAILEQTIRKESRSGPIFFFANPGNWGDALIRCGTLEFFRQYRLDYKELRTRPKSDWIWAAARRGTLLYGGGGGWCQLYNHSVHLVKKVRRLFKNVIVLPSSYQMRYAIPNTIFFCRDMYESQNNMPDSLFCHDMSFALEKLPPAEGTGAGYFFRRDAASLNRIKIPSENNDISSEGNQYSRIEPFIKAIGMFSKIHTDRLHIGIAACMMEKEVHFYPSSYFKNRAVFRSSIEGFYQNAHFHDFPS